MQRIKLPSVKEIKNGKLEKVIPELYALKGTVENNPWHNQEPVFDHVLSVLENLGKIIRDSNKSITKLFDEIVDVNSKKDLLYLATLLHDIGKGETITDLGNGARGCPNHEKKSAQITEKILKRFNLSPKESKIIIDIVGNHGIIHDIIGLKCKNFKKGGEKEHDLTHAIAGLENKNFNEEYRKFKNKFSKIYPELIFLAFADTVGSYLKKTEPSEFSCRIDFCKKEILSFYKTS